MPFDKLPVELIFEIGQACLSQTDLLNLSRTCKLFHSVLDKQLIPYNITHNHSTGLRYAAKLNDIALTRRFLTCTTKPDINTNIITIRELLKKVYESPVTELPSVEDIITKKPLWIAFRRSHEELTILLLENGADTELTHWVGYQEMLRAGIKNSRYNIVCWLLKRGAGEIQNDCYPFCGEWMVDIAVRNADIPMLGALFAHLQVSYPSVAKAHEDRALAYAAEIGCLEVVKALYKRMLAAQAQGHRFTQKDPLYAAIEHGHHEVVKWLLQEGADLCGDTGAWDNALQALCDGVTDSPSASAAVLKVLAMMDTLLGACADIADGANRVYVTQLVQMKRFILANIL